MWEPLSLVNFPKAQLLDVSCMFLQSRVTSSLQLNACEVLSVLFFYVDLQRLEPFWVFLYLTFFLCNPWTFFKSCSVTVFKCYYLSEFLNVSIYFKICIVTFIVKTPTVQEYIDHIPWDFPIWSRNKEVTNVNSWFDSLETFIHAHKHIHECTQVLVKIWINGIMCKSSDTLFTSQCTLEVFPSPYTCIYFIIHCLQYSPYFGWILTWSLLFDRHLGCFHRHTSNLGVQKPSVVIFCFAHFSHDPLSNTESNPQSHLFLKHTTWWNAVVISIASVMLGHLRT